MCEHFFLARNVNSRHSVHMDTTNTTANDEGKAAATSRVGAFLTARQMAFKAHRLSKDGMTAAAKDGGIWKWSNHFNVWACVDAR